MRVGTFQMTDELYQDARAREVLFKDMIIVSATPEGKGPTWTISAEGPLTSVSNAGRLLMKMVLVPFLLI